MTTSTRIFAAVALMALSLAAQAQPRIDYPLYLIASYSGYEFNPDVGEPSKDRLSAQSLTIGHSIGRRLDLEVGYGTINTGAISLRALSRVGAEDSAGQGVFLIGGLGYSKFGELKDESIDWHPSAILGGEVQGERLLFRITAEAYRLGNGSGNAISAGFGYRF